MAIYTKVTAETNWDQSTSQVKHVIARESQGHYGDHTTKDFDFPPSFAPLNTLSFHSELQTIDKAHGCKNLFRCLSIKKMY